MEITGEYQIDSGRQAVWQALNDAEMLQQCIPGCESLEKVSETEFNALVVAAIGPVRARFKTKLSLKDLKPPESYRLVGESKGGVAGFGRGSASVFLEEKDGGTLLRYEADFKVGGKLAQVGSRLVLGATRKMADEFFGAFSKALDPAAVRIGDDGQSAGLPGSWYAIGTAIVVLLVWWFLLR